MNTKKRQHTLRTFMCFGDTGNFHNTAHIYMLTDVNELNDVICLLPSCHLFETVINMNTGVTSHTVSLKLHKGLHQIWS
jgi:hypothetical protein